MSYHIYEYIASVYIYSDDELAYGDYVIDIGAYQYRKLIWKYERRYSKINNLTIRSVDYNITRKGFQFNEVVGLKRMLLFK
jgi:hypothetical protein